MASSNVDYYQRQNDFQDSIMESEQRRKTLEAQLQAYCRSDQKMAKLRAVKLQSYWKRICEDEKRSKQRNSQLLRDLDRIDANMASLEARREKLKYMKQQYFDQIERAYPKWMDLVMQKRQEQNQQQQQQLQHQQQHQQQQQQQPQTSQHLQQHQTSPAYQQQNSSPQQSYQQQQQQQYQQQQQFQQQQYKQQQYQQQQQSFHHQQEREPNLPTQSNMYGNGISDEDEEEDVAPPLPSHPPPAAFSGSKNMIPEREYTNLKDVHRPAQSVPTSPPAVPSVTVHMPNVGGDSSSLMKPGGEGGVAGGGDKDVSFSFSEEVNIQPIQSVTVRQKNEAARAVVPTMTAGSDDDVSDLEEDPSAAGIKHEQRSSSPPITPSPPTHREEEEEEEEEEDLAPVVVHPEITTSGIVRLLKFVEEELGNALSVESYYRSRNPDPATRKEIIFKANGSSGLGNVDAELVSMVILEQLTPLIRRLPGACLLTDTILQGNLASLTESHIRDNLHRDSLPLWDKLMEHFVCLVKNNVLGTRELAFVFIPCLVHDNSVMQDKAVHVLDQIVERLVLRGQGAMSPVHDSLDTARSSQQGTVPRLKFGSLVDSRQFTDEESSMITQSMNTETNNKVPLNETDAYKNLISGNQPAQKPGLAADQQDDDTDNSDNDLEKQFVSTLSPRSHASTIKSVLGSTGGSTQQRKLAGMISSDLDSEPDMDLGHIGDKKEEEDDDFFEFYG